VRVHVNMTLKMVETLTVNALEHDSPLPDDGVSKSTTQLERLLVTIASAAQASKAPEVDLIPRLRWIHEPRREAVGSVKVGQLGQLLVRLFAMGEEQAVGSFEFALDPLLANEGLVFVEHSRLMRKQETGVVWSDAFDQLGQRSSRQLRHVAEVAAAGTEAEVTLLD